METSSNMEVDMGEDLGDAGEGEDGAEDAEGAASTTSEIGEDLTTSVIGAVTSGIEATTLTTEGSTVSHKQTHKETSKGGATSETTTTTILANSYPFHYIKPL